MLTVNHIQKHYEGKPLLRDVSFQLEEDETVCLLGPSGSGKSTLLRIIAGLEEAESGDITWNGQSLSDIPAHQRQFGLMFQDYALFPHRNVAENIAFGLRMQNQTKTVIEEHVQKALATINMSDFAHRKVTDLSGGEQQRVALARALAPDPRLLMLDEPLGALDRTLREQLSRELRRILHETRVPAIYVTHDQEEAFAIADRLLILHDGVILQSGKPHEIYHHPRNVWVADFFGLGNLVAGEVLQNSPIKVRTPLGIIQSTCERETLAEGQRVSLLFRPTRACNQQANCPNLVTGKVIDRVFQGEDYLVILYINEKIPHFRVTLIDPPQIGETISVAFQPEDVLCLSNEVDPNEK